MSARLHAPEGAKFSPRAVNKLKVGDHVYAPDGGYWFTVRKRRMYRTYLALWVTFQRVGPWRMTYRRRHHGETWPIFYTSLTAPETLLDWRT